MFYGGDLNDVLKCANARENEATIFGYKVKDPRRYGVVEIDELKEKMDAVWQLLKSKQSEEL